MKRLVLIIAGGIVMSHLGLAGNSTPSADEQYAVFIEVANEMPQYANCFRLVGHQYDSHTATYIFACQSVGPGKAEWLVFVPGELANNVNVVCALFNQATVDHDSWKEEVVSKSSDQ